MHEYHILHIICPLERKKNIQQWPGRAKTLYNIWPWCVTLKMEWWKVHMTPSSNDAYVYEVFFLLSWADQKLRAEQEKVYKCKETIITHPPLDGSIKTGLKSYLEYCSSHLSSKQLTSNEECHKVVQHKLFVFFSHAFFCCNRRGNFSDFTQLSQML